MMIEETVKFPFAFYFALGLLIAGFAYAWKMRTMGIGIPLGAVLGTVGIWYFGDALYNDYQQYSIEIGAQYLEAAWWQVALFIFALLTFVQMLHRSMNRRLLGDRSEFWELMNLGGIDNAEFQRRLDVATRLIFSVC